MPTLCYHVDTNYLIEYLDYHNRPEEEQGRLANRVINLLMDKAVLKISQIVAGELIMVVARDRPTSSIVDNLFTRVKSKDFSVCEVTLSELPAYSTLANAIRQEDYEIEPTDALIIAHSMADAQCRGLLTFENKLIQSEGITRARAKHLKGRKYTITSKL